MAQQGVQLRYLKMAPRKVRLVADMIKGISANEAEAQLLIQRRRAAKPLLKLLRSAMASAKNSKGINPDQLFIQEIRVDQGPMLKRYLPRARGRATPLQKKMSHIKLVLAENPQLAKPRYKIVVPKKTKLPPELQGKGKRAKPLLPEAETERKPKQAGFFRRIFNRKSLASK